MKRLIRLAWGRRRAVRWLVPLAVAGATVFLITSALGTLTGSTFNAGDGNMKIDTGDTHDWQDAVATFGSAYSGVLTDVFDSRSDDAFTSGQTRDTPCPAVSGRKSPPRDDFTAAAYASETNASTGDIFLYGATFRYAGNGKASENIELNQGANGQCAGSALFQRVAGDKLIAIDYLSGGASAAFHVLTWVTDAAGTCFAGHHSPPCWGSNVVALSPAQAEAGENAGAILAADNSITHVDVGQFQFAEFGVNLTAALGITGCGKIAGAVFEARAPGSSFVSRTKDIIIGNHPLAPCLPAITTTASATQFDANGNANISDTATITGASPLAVGTITFKAWGPQADPNSPMCTGTPAGTKTVQVTGNGAFASGDISVSQAGTYAFTADYSGDLAHGTPAVSSLCGADGESATLTTLATVTVINPAIDLKKSPPSQSIPGGGTANFTIPVTNMAMPGFPASW